LQADNPKSFSAPQKRRLNTGTGRSLELSKRPRNEIISVESFKAVPLDSVMVTVLGVTIVIGNDWFSGCRPCILRPKANHICFYQGFKTITSQNQKTRHLSPDGTFFDKVYPDKTSDYRTSNE